MWNYKSFLKAFLIIQMWILQMLSSSRCIFFASILQDKKCFVGKIKTIVKRPSKTAESCSSTFCWVSILFQFCFYCERLIQKLNTVGNPVCIVTRFIGCPLIFTLLCNLKIRLSIENDRKPCKYSNKKCRVSATWNISQGNAKPWKLALTNVFFLFSNPMM